jgi:hypothetical protein
MMSTALQRYKDLVDQLRGLSPSAAESTVNSIDEQLKEAWIALGESDRVEAEAYWRSSTTAKTARPEELN